MKVTLVVFPLFMLILGISYTAKINRVLYFRMQAPVLEKKIHEEEAKKAKFELEWLMYANPERLLRLKEKPHFGHLVMPLQEQIFCIQENEVAHGVQ